MRILVASFDSAQWRLSQGHGWSLTRVPCFPKTGLVPSAENGQGRRGLALKDFKTGRKCACVDVCRKTSRKVDLYVNPCSCFGETLKYASLTARFWIFCILPHVWPVAFVCYWTETFHVGITNSMRLHAMCTGLMATFPNHTRVCPLRPRFDWAGDLDVHRNSIGWKSLQDTE